MSYSLRRSALIAAVAAGIVIATPGIASAHVGVSPDAVPRASSTLLTFSFSHGCGESPTTALRITIPEESPVAAPTFDAAWDVEIEKGADRYTSAITYTAIRPVPNGVRGAVSLSFRAAENAPEQLVFPVEQICESGSSEWTEVAAPGQDPHELESPAPAVTLTSGTSSADHDHGADATADGDASAEGADAAEGDAPADHDGAKTPDAAEADSPVPTVLAGAGLLTGVAALIVAIAAYRRRA